MCCLMDVEGGETSKRWIIGKSSFAHSFMCMHAVSCFVAQKICSFVESFNSFLDLFTSLLILSLCVFIVNFLLNLFSVFSAFSLCTSFFRRFHLLCSARWCFFLICPRESEKKKEVNKKKHQPQLFNTFSLACVLVAGFGCRINNNNVL